MISYPPPPSKRPGNLSVHMGAITKAVKKPVNSERLKKAVSGVPWNIGTGHGKRAR